MVGTSTVTSRGVPRSGSGAHPAVEPLHGAQLEELSRELERVRGLLDAAQDRERLLRRELQHGVRNMLATIRSVFRQSREGGASQDEFAEHFQGRLDAIARYHAGGLVDPSGSVELEDVVREELLAVHCVEGADCTIEGGSVRLRGRSLELVGLALHELTTNALKFGALAGGGRLVVSWATETAGDGSTMVRFRWVETGVAMVSIAPRPSGFGRQLLEEALPYELDAAVSFQLKPGGLAFSLDFPLRDAGDASSDHITDDLFVNAREG